MNRTILNSLLLALLLCLLVSAVLWRCEVHLQQQGNIPGLLNPMVDFENSDSLVLNPCYTVDSFGIMKFSEYSRSAINSAVQKSLDDKQLYVSDSVKKCFKQDLVQTYLPFMNGGAFYKWADSIQKLPSNSTDTLLSMLKEYISNPVNSEGFRSIFFRNISTNKKKVLLIGDSFTYGYSANPLTDCFAEQMLINGKYVVYNAGITCTDPVQYLQVAKKYLPVLQPDYVVVTFFMGNDVMNFDRQPAPYQFASYPVNDKLITANPYGVYLSLSDANKVVRLNNILPNQKTNPVNRLLAKTVLGTRLWMLVAKTHLLNTTDKELRQYFHPEYEKNDPVLVTRKIVNEIFEVAKANHSKLIFAVVPDACITNPWNQKIKIDTLFEGFRYVKASETKDWYNPYPDGHFNNYGHKNYAEMLMGIIDSAN